MSVSPRQRARTPGDDAARVPDADADGVRGRALQPSRVVAAAVPDAPGQPGERPSRGRDDHAGREGRARRPRDADADRRGHGAHRVARRARGSRPTATSRATRASSSSFPRAARRRSSPATGRARFSPLARQRPAPDDARRPQDHGGTARPRSTARSRCALRRCRCPVAPRRASSCGRARRARPASSRSCAGSQAGSRLSIGGRVTPARAGRRVLSYG